MSGDIVERLRALALHDDLSIGIVAADEIEQLTRERDEARAEVERLTEALGVSISNHDNASLEIERQQAEIERLRAEKDKLREEKEALHVAVARIERASAGAIYSQELIYVIASSALEALEAKP